MKKTTLSNSLQTTIDAVITLINTSRNSVVRSINHEMLITYWNVGRHIFEEEQNSQAKAEYGKKIMQKLSNSLTKKFGKGFSYPSLYNMRQFYQTYQNYNPAHKVSSSHQELTIAKHFLPNISWTHYKALIREKRPAVRNFYEIEASKNQWSVLELSRQMNSFLFERLEKSKDKAGLMELANEGQVIKNPIDALKDPVVLEFLNIPESHKLLESDLEDALITHLKNFLLELGEGFAFVGRQKRITLDGDHFYPDLIFYHTVLKCYTIVELKTKKLTHQDLGQLQMYVNYYDREMLTEGDNPTIGLALCAERNDAVVKYTLSENNKQIFARNYQCHLPSEQQLQEVLEKELAELNLETGVRRVNSVSQIDSESAK